MYAEGISCLEMMSFYHGNLKVTQDSGLERDMVRLQKNKMAAAMFSQENFLLQIHRPVLK